MSDTGWKSPGTVVDDSSVGTKAWSNPSNAKANDSTYAELWAMSSTFSYSHYLKATNFGFNVPSGATITGIEAQIKRGDVYYYTYDENVRLVLSNGSIGSENKAKTTTNWGSIEYIAYGGSSDLWSETLSASDINDTDFGLVLSIKLSDVSNGEIGNNEYVDHIQIKVYYTESGNATSERNIYSKGKTTGGSEKNIYSRGKLTNSSERLLRSIGGGIVSSERGIYTTSGAGESQRGIYSLGKPNPVAIPFYQGKNEKKYSVKIYDRAGTTFKGNYDPIGGYAFTKTINGGVGALSITLPRKFDNFGLGEDVNLLDEIQVWVQDKDTSGKKIYSGYVSSITSFIDGSNQGIKLDVLGYVSRLAFTLDWNGTDISMVRNSLTAGELVKDVIDKYRSTVAEERINYGTSTVDITGSDISYTSNAKSCLETIERAREMAGATWYWYVDADNVFYFREYATTPTHLFTFGKDISSLEITRSADDIKNEFIFWNGLMADDTNFISNRYYNTTSINSYWNRFEANTDGRVTTSAGADALGDSYINAYKNPNVSMRFEVKDNNLGAGYDIESIEPGHTCKILNLNDSDVVGDNMVITSVQYTPEKVIIYVSDLKEMTGRSLTNLRRQLDSTVYGDRPTKLTSKAIT